MPAKFLIKTYRGSAYYHVFNRGAFKTKVFRDDQDCLYFMACVRSAGEKVGISIPVYAVMPNHFHLQILQTAPRDMVFLMSSALTRYCLYFKKKYDSSGKIFQGTYKAVLLTSLEKIHENREYILSNPSRARLKKWLYVGENLL